MDKIKAIEHEQMKNVVPKLKVGNTVKVHEGTIIKIQNGGLNQTFTVRRISYGVGVEKTFLIHSQNVEKVELVRVGKARRAKLTYLRDRLGKKAKTKEVVGARIVNEEITIKEEKVLVPETAEEEVVEIVIEEVVEEGGEVNEEDIYSKRKRNRKKMVYNRR